MQGLSYILVFVTNKAKMLNEEVIKDIVIYADVLFGINFVSDFMVLLITDWILHYSARLSRMLISATFGAVWSVISVCIPLRFALPVKIITYGPVILIMVMVMFSGSGMDRQRTSKQLKLYMRSLLKGCVVMITSALFMGGIMHGLKYTFAGYFIGNVILSDSELVLFLTVSIVLCFMIIRLLRSMRMEDSLKRHIVIGVQGHEIEMDAIIDTGNTLVDYIGKRPVTVVERTYFDNILSDIDNLHKLQYHLIPYNCVGKTGGMMEIITADYIHIYNGDEMKKCEYAAIGLSGSKINGNGEFHALLGRKMIE